jgi:hypothetical protein
MEGFKKSNKMQCFKEGKSVKYKSRHSEKHEMSEDIAKDKAIVKKAFKMHDEQSHEGEKTNLSKLKKGGRAKKEVGTVKKYQAGGSVENAYGAKKTAKDIKDIANTKRQKPTMLCGGKSVKKYAEGQAVESDDIGGSILRRIGKVPMVGKSLESVATRLRNNVMGTPEQNRIAREQRLAMERKKAAAAAAATGAGISGIEKSALGAAPAAAASAPMGSGNVTNTENALSNPYKNGRKVKKYADGGSVLKSVDSEENPGLEKLPTHVRNKMGYMRSGGKAKKMNTGGSSGPISKVAQDIIEGKRPAQETPGKMTPEERRASIGKAFGAKKMNTGGTCS